MLFYKRAMPLPYYLKRRKGTLFLWIGKKRAVNNIKEQREQFILKRTITCVFGYIKESRIIK